MSIATPEPDDIDQALLDARMARYIANEGPAVGDLVIFPDGEYRRFIHNWGDSIQTTCKTPAHGTSFYLTSDGYMSFSGGLDPAIPKADIVRVDECKPGLIWFFHHDESKAHNSVNAEIPCRVYRYIPASGDRRNIMTDREAMLAIQSLMDGKEWNSDTLGAIAQVMEDSGHRLRDLDAIDSMEEDSLHA
jgi:hypothetical protein